MDWVRGDGDLSFLAGGALSALETLEASTHKAETHKHLGFNFTEYTITGDLHSVLYALRELFIQYHPMSYGSRIQKMEMLDNGTYRAIFWRGNSGD